MHLQTVSQRGHESSSRGRGLDTLRLRQMILLIVIAVPAIALGDEPQRTWIAGTELMLVQPHLDDNLAILQSEEDLQANTRIREFHFDHKLAAAPRFWIEYLAEEEMGFRLAGWFFRSSAKTITQRPPANGFGELTHPELAGIDLSSVIPAEQMTAGGTMDLATIDAEVTRRALFHVWQLELAAGLRYASIDQRYQWSLRNELGNLAGEAVWDQETGGIGPTLRIASRRPVLGHLGALEAGLRTSLLLSNQELSIQGREDVDLPTPFRTDLVADSDAILPMVEARLGSQWSLERLRLSGWVCGFGYETLWTSDLGTPANTSADLVAHGLFFSMLRLW